MSRRKRMLENLDNDIRNHIAQRTQDNIDRGMAPEEARNAALRKFGNVGLVKEDTRAVWSLVWLEQFLQDIRFGLRMMRKNPGFTAVAVLTLALGIGANTAIFSAVNGILIEHLPYLDASRLLEISREQVAYNISFAEVRDMQEGCPAFESMAVYRGFAPVILSGATPEVRSSSYVSGDFFPMLGVQPFLGRVIIASDTKPGSAPVAVLSYRLWIDEFGSDPRVIGRDVAVEKNLYTVVGVMPKDFELGVDWLGWSGDATEGLWVPLVPPTSVPGKRGRQGGEIIARVKRGTTFAAAKAQLQVFSERFARTFPKDAEGVQLIANVPALNIDRKVRTGLLILLGAVGFVLLMASVNVSALLVARARTRQNELAIRRTLGASRTRIIRQLLSESMMLALAGGTIGLLLSIWGVRLLRAIAPPGTPRVDRIQLDHNVMWFTLGISLLAAFLFGLLPALQASSRRMWGVMKGNLGGSFVSSGRGERRSVRSALIIAEVALAVILVAGGALMLRSFEKLMQVNTGVQADHVLTMNVQFSEFGCISKDGDTKCPNKDESILDELNSLPGVEKVALSEVGVLRGGFDWRAGLHVEGVQGDLSFSGLARPVTPGYFETTGVRLLAGRNFVGDDADSETPVAIVSERFARKYIPGNPLGHRFSTHDDKTGHHVWMEIVGVVNDTRDRAVMDYDNPIYYTPFTLGGLGQSTIIARTSVNPMSLAKTIEQVVWSVDKYAPISDVRTVDQILSDSAAQPKFQAVLLGSFSVLGLFLAMIGIYGVISYSVVQRTHEIGVRMALGAAPGDVMRLILGQGAMLAVFGIAVGLASALALTRFLRSLLFEIKANDPATFIGVAILLLIVALLACYIPARRAMRVDPMVALRYE
jgi:predicted permease